MSKMKPTLHISTKTRMADLDEYSPSTPLMTEDASAGESDEDSEYRLDSPNRKHPAASDGLKFPDEPLKLLFSAIFLGSGFILTTCSLVLAHESMPDYPPLPDFFLDSVSYMEWGLDYSEYLLVTCLALGIIVIVFHAHRTIVLRRICFTLGLLYMYRACTVFVTSIPKSNPDYYCAEKYNGSLPFREFVSRVAKIVAGGGLSFSHQQVYCGDFIFSGHTMMFVISYLTVKEYTPSSWFFFHWVMCILASTGIIFLLVGRGHYTVDVVIAYLLVTRLWWGYHTMANMKLKFRSKGNAFSKLWWFRIFRYLEGNVPGIVPHRYSVPLPKKLKTYIYSKCCGKEKKDDMATV